MKALFTITREQLQYMLSRRHLLPPKGPYGYSYADFGIDVCFLAVSPIADILWAVLRTVWRAPFYVVGVVVSSLTGFSVKP